MGTGRTGTALVAAAGAAVTVVGGRALWRAGRRRLGAATPDDAAADRRWQVITVDRPVDEVVDRAVERGPVADLGDTVEVETTEAPGGRGTELRVRVRVRGGVTPGGNASPGRPELRLALRRAKQLVEVGEILAVGPQPAGHRPRTPAGSLLDSVVRRAPERGLL